MDKYQEELLKAFTCKMAILDIDGYLIEQCIICLEEALIEVEGMRK